MSKKARWDRFNEQLTTIGCLRRYFHNFAPKLDCKEQLTLTLLEPTAHSFLITGDEVLDRPYVWRWVVGAGGNCGSMETDPLELESCSNWNNGDVHVMDIIGELFCVEKEGLRYEKFSVFNPFQVDLAPMGYLQPDVKLKESSRLMQVLEAVFKSERLTKLELKVVEDYQLVSNIHFSAYYDIANRRQPTPEDVGMAEERCRVLKKKASVPLFDTLNDLALGAGDGVTSRPSLWSSRRRPSLPTFSLLFPSPFTAAATPTTMRKDVLVEQSETHDARRRIQSDGPLASSDERCSSSPPPSSKSSTTSTTSSGGGAADMLSSSLGRLGARLFFNDGQPQRRKHSGGGGGRATPLGVNGGAYSSPPMTSQNGLTRHHPVPDVVVEEEG